MNQETRCIIGILDYICSLISSGMPALGIEQLFELFFCAATAVQQKASAKARPKGKRPK